MRISAAELQAVSRAGALTRYALLGPVAFIAMELPASGTEGTGLDEPCVTEHHGIVSRGWFAVHHADGRTERFEEGDAFYVPPGPPAHHFTSSPGCIAQGFAPTVQPPDTSEIALKALGFSVVAEPGRLALPPASVRLAGDVDPFKRHGAIDVEGSRMGPWLFMRSRFGPRSGFTSGWCDLPHWGLTLDGEVAITYEDRTELAARGDVYYAEPGHKVVSPDGATIADYTPIAELGHGRVSTWRRSVIDIASIDETPPPPVASAVQRPASRPTARLRLSLT